MATARTVRQVIEGALRIVGAIAQGETPEADDINTALKVLQDLLAEWSDGGLMVPCYVKEEFDLTARQTSYTIGENGAPDFNTVRPEQIIGAYIRSGNYDYPVKIIDERAYRNISNKSTEGRPGQLWYNAGAPNGTIYLWYTPGSDYPLWITSVKPFTEPTNLAENLLNVTEIPRNYHNALKWNLAFELGPEYGKEPSATIIKRAKETEDKIISLNAARRVQPARLDSITGHGWTNNDLIGR